MTEAGDFDDCLGCLVEPALADLDTGLRGIAGLTRAEAKAVHDGAAAALLETVRRKVTRTLVLELNAARVTGRLTGADPAARWSEFLELAARREFWDSLTEHYPTLLARVDAIVANRCAAALELATRFAADRDPALGELREVTFGAGDSHRHGRTVAIVRCANGNTVYKPRPVEVDRALSSFLSTLDVQIRVPDVVVRDGYGWAEFVTHRHCADDGELRDFYRGIGHWLAISRLVGGSDLHAENLIACGPVPIVVDCETLFTPSQPIEPSRGGIAVDKARDLVANSVLRTGLLPGRGMALGWRGVDMSATGSLPDQQPVTELPVVLGVGTDTAHVGKAVAEIPLAGNHPSPEPVLARYWPQVLAGFDELTGRLTALDRDGRLAALLEPFQTCEIRIVKRATEQYAEIGRMLWHPVSLHGPEQAIERAAKVLESPEIDDLLTGDIPFYPAVPGSVGVGEALDRWRRGDVEVERQVIRAALVSAYLNDGWMPDEKPMRPTVIRTDDLDRRRRRLAAELMQRLVRAAIRGADGTATWIAPVLSDTGWTVRPLSQDVYGGSAGVAMVLAGYQHEVAADRADPVPGVDSLLADTRRSFDGVTADMTQWRKDHPDHRPPQVGAYLGLGGLLWFQGSAGAADLAAAVAADQQYDVLMGMAGAIVPLLGLGRVDEARDIGDRLVDAAQVVDGKAHWASIRWPAGLGGFAHGSTGISWALDRLALVTGDDRYAAVAEAAQRYEESLYKIDRNGWLDNREKDRIGTAWCHGAAGIGIAAADLWHRTEHPQHLDVLRRSAQSMWPDSFGWNHTLCHGDLGCWEVVKEALDAGVGPAGLCRRELDAHVIGGLEEFGAISGLARDAFSPGLLPGLGGVAYQLLRMHPASDLPSVLLPHA
ncbi:type 2 lanthipeptide synthetase LanM family protein [Kutzneria chonburiensis]|uniref:Type 2 lanthipeptide synthetase LanM family protein n=1 Tax=Kutzneria chonburiensis TaxID=1483604 RepID=A0ABV6MT19_9PSEU